MSRRAEPGPLPRGKLLIFLSGRGCPPSPPPPRWQGRARFFRSVREGGVCVEKIETLFFGRQGAWEVVWARGARVLPGPVLDTLAMRGGLGLLAAGACECGKSGAR
jgi:hypothetical protein